MRPRLLDLFCGAGGAGAGYARAGFDVVGVDLADQPNYPFPFLRADALQVLGSGFWRSFDAIHASPPCQSYSRAMRHLADDKPKLIDDVAARLEQTGLVWVIENVPGAPIPTQPTIDGLYGVELCGTMFGLRIKRHRLFRSNVGLSTATGCRCSDVTVLNPHHAESRRRIRDEFGAVPYELPWRREMGIEWMTRDEARQAIPPAYTELIGHQLLAHLTTEVAA